MQELENNMLKALGKHMASPNLLLFLLRPRAILMRRTAHVWKDHRRRVVLALQ